MQVLERNINTQTERLENGNILVRSSILDLHHNMYFQMEIDLESREIRKAGAEMIKTPYPECRNALAGIHELEGLKLERGLFKRMVDILGRNTGCTHMLEIAMTASRTASYAILTILSEGERWKDIMASDEERFDVVRTYLDNSCVVFKR